MSSVAASGPAIRGQRIRAIAASTVENATLREAEGAGAAGS
jgi:hypothetical protein